MSRDESYCLDYFRLKELANPDSPRLAIELNHLMECDQCRKQLHEFGNDRLREAFNPDERCADCPDDDAGEIVRIEVNFSIPVLMTQANQQALVKLIADMTKEPWNVPKEGVHWLSGVGSRPQWSKADAMFLGKPADENAPDDGEPTFDDTVFSMETCAREFVSDKERNRSLENRSAIAKAEGAGQ